MNAPKNPRDWLTSGGWGGGWTSGGFIIMFMIMIITIISSIITIGGGLLEVVDAAEAAGELEVARGAVDNLDC